MQNEIDKKCSTILMAEDDPDDRFLMARVFRELGLDGSLRFVSDGEELMHYLYFNGTPSDSAGSRPVLLFLDLNMPRKDGREALVEIKTDPNFRELPVVVWTTSNHHEDKTFCYKNGADLFITKPHGYGELVKTIQKVLSKWMPPAG